MALAAGVPLVVSGLGQDEAQVAARVAWTGMGLDLASDDPGADALGAAVARVLSNSVFRARATCSACSMT
ncbi:MAG: hypothetical protein ACRYGP_06505 [Janthinobacterium lividum]